MEEMEKRTEGKDLGRKDKKSKTREDKGEKEKNER